MEPCKPWQVSPTPNTWSGAKGLATLQPAKISIRSNLKNPLVPLHSTLFTSACPRLALHEAHDTSTRNSITVFLLHLASPRSDRPSSTAAGRGCWPSSLGVRSTRATSFTPLGSASGLLLVPCGHYIAASEKSPSRGASIHAWEHKVQTLSQQSGLSQGRIPNRSKKPPRKCHLRPWARSPVGF